MTKPTARWAVAIRHGRLRVLVKDLLARVTLVVEFCHDCGRRQPVYWATDPSLWSVVTGRADGGGVLCPDCFDRRATALGLLLRWEPIVEHRR